jgi:tRNA pseudouridine38-40 synthase
MRYALGVEYDGGDFRGWQRLSPHGRPGEPTVQAALEEALSAVAAAPVEVICAGRTDAGVHAQCQVVHFDSDAPRSPRSWSLGTTSRLPPSVCVRWCVPVADDFNARFSARARRYRYRILNRWSPPALDKGRVWHVKRAIDAAAMHEAAQVLVGHHDFTTFRDLKCQAKSPVKTLDVATVRREGDEVVLEFAARSFLHRQVRSMAGTLVEVGLGRWTAHDVKAALEAKDRAKCGPVAPSAGLYLSGVRYD